MNKNDTEINFLLGLFQAGYKNAYVSLMNFQTPLNNSYHRINMVLPNVGRLCLYQTFVEVLDEQIPHTDIFYSDALNPNIITKIHNKDLVYRAANIIYTTEKYFEQHPEHIVTDDNFTEIIKRNQKLFQKQQEKMSKKRLGILRTFFINQK